MSISETKTDEFDTLLEHFNSLIEPFDGLMAKIADKRFLPRQELREAQEQYKSIKETLNAESKELQHRRMTDLDLK